MEAASPCSERFMLLGPDRVFYAGLLGRPRRRTMGCFMLAAAQEGQLTLTFDGAAPRRLTAAVLPPYVEHTLESESPQALSILIEPETVDPAALARLKARVEAGGEEALADLIRKAYAALRVTPLKHKMTTEDFDRATLGAILPRRAMDPRIAAVVAGLAARPGDVLTAADCASQARLSVSRFLHLFKQETGCAFRAFRAWRRARHLLNFANSTINMAHLALDIGYPDSTHFSHSIRRFYGMQPRAIFSGSRRLEIFRSAGAPAA